MNGPTPIRPHPPADAQVGQLTLEVDENSEPDDDQTEIVPLTGVYVSLLPADGMRYTASVYVEGEASPDQLAEMIRRATVATAAAHSPDLLDVVRGPGY